MLARPFRLHRRKDIERVLRYGRSFTTPLFRFKVAPNKLTHTRATVIVSAKVSKRAVVRNQLKRRAREIIRLNFATLPPKNDLLIMIQPAAKSSTYQQMEKDILYATKSLSSQVLRPQPTTYPPRIHRQKSFQSRSVKH